MTKLHKPEAFNAILSLMNLIVASQLTTGTPLKNLAWENPKQNFSYSIN